MRVISGMSNNRLIIVIAVAIILLGGASLFLIGNQEKKAPEEKVFLEDGGEYIPFFGCPVTDCTSATTVNTANGSYVGVGFIDIPEDFGIRAIVDGTYVATLEGDETTIILTDKDGIEVTYRFKGSSKSEGEAVKGEGIGIYSGKIINVSASATPLSLFVVVRDTRTGNVIPVGPDQISNSLKIL